MGGWVREGAKEETSASCEQGLKAHCHEKD